MGGEMSKKKTWAVVHTFLMDMCLSQNQTADQIMKTVHWHKFKDEMTYWKKKTEEFLETSRPGDMFSLKDHMYIFREKPGG
jgi:hypothetical protein